MNQSNEPHRPEGRVRRKVLVFGSRLGVNDERLQWIADTCEAHVCFFSETKDEDISAFLNTGIYVFGNSGVPTISNSTTMEDCIKAQDGDSSVPVYLWVETPGIDSSDIEAWLWTHVSSHHPCYLRGIVSRTPRQSALPQLVLRETPSDQKRQLELFFQVDTLLK